jgi:peptide/nickel transport system substrate-binding protein
MSERRITRREFVTIGTAGLAGLTLAACAPVAIGPSGVVVPTTAVAAVKRGGVVHTVMGTGLPTLNPILSTWLHGFFEMIYDPLLRAEIVDPEARTYEIKPALAESWEWNDDNSEVTFNLREGVTFHDGSAWNADVAHWNLDMIFNHPQSLPKNLFEGLIKDFEVVAPMQVRITLNSPSATLLLNLSNSSGRVYFISKKHFEAVGEEAFGADPSGTGPFQFDSWVKEDRVTLKRYDGYWLNGEDGQSLPYLDGLEYRLIPETATQVVELRSGNLDFINIAEASIVSSLQADSAINVVENPISGAFYICVGLNQRVGLFGENPLVRQAALHALNREAMLKTFGFGLGTLTPYPYWREGMVGYNDTLPYYDYDPDKAKALLAQAGFPDGVDVTLTVIQRPLEQQQAEVIKQMWDSAGLRTTLEVLERTAWIAKMQEGNADAGFWRYTNPVDTDQMSRAVVTDSVGNWGNYSNPKVDDLMAQARQILDDAERQTLYEEAQRLIYGDACLLTCYFQTDHYGVQKYVQGLVFDTNQERLHTVWLNK